MSTERFNRIVEARIATEREKNDQGVYPLVAWSDEAVIVGSGIFETFPAVFSGAVELQLSGIADYLNLFVERSDANPALGPVTWRSIADFSLPRLDGVSRYRTLHDGLYEPGAAWWRLQALASNDREMRVTVSLTGEVEASISPSFKATFDTPDGPKTFTRRYPGQSSNEWARDLADKIYGNETKALRNNFVTEAFRASGNAPFSLQALDERGSPLAAAKMIGGAL